MLHEASTIHSQLLSDDINMAELEDALIKFLHIEEKG